MTIPDQGDDRQDELNELEAAVVGLDPEELKERLAVLPLRGTVLFPGVIAPIVVARSRSMRLVTSSLREGRIVAVTGSRREDVRDPEPADLYAVGVAARMLKVLRLPNGNLNVILQGVERVRLDDWNDGDPYFRARAEILPTTSRDLDVEVEALMVSGRRLLERLAQASASLPSEPTRLAKTATRPGDLADIVATYLNVPVVEKQRALEALDERERLALVIEQLGHQVQVLELSQKIESDVQGEMDRGQREIYLRERLRAIKRELGEDDDGEEAEIEELSKRIDDASMPEDVDKVTRKELDRLSRMSPMAAEYTVLRTYIDWLLDMPWGKITDDLLDIRAAAATLDEDHYNLEKVKKRILEFLAVRKLKPDTKGPILCFVGPPGVGKTSLGRSIARALGREFVRISLGGVHDEAEIRGHRRTYVGSLPGRIIQGIKRAGALNPVFMLDEMDKLGRDFRGDPSSALLEVLDPEQNSTFSDHYLEVDFDLSKVLFIATGNDPEGIPAVLRDRMEVLDLPGYTSDEKLAIARTFLVPRQREEHGLDASLVSFDDAAILSMVVDYTQEAGVRELERQIAAVCRAVARRVAESMGSGSDDRGEEVAVAATDLHGYLGPVRYFNEVAERTSDPGVAVGLAWTTTGGEILFIEATRMPGKGVLRLTGQLGDVMKESAEAALSYLRARASELGIADEEFRTHDVHVHVPAGAVPKDGPSAGVALLVALASLFTGRQVHSDLGMTGEITLRGMLLPVGGVKNKVLAAHRAGLSRVLMPSKNEKDLDEIPEAVRQDLKFLFVERVREAIDLALSPGDE